MELIRAALAKHKIAIWLHFFSKGIKSHTTFSSSIFSRSCIIISYWTGDGPKNDQTWEIFSKLEAQLL